MKTAFSFLLTVLLAACSQTQEFISRWQPADRSGPQAVIVFDMQQGGRLVYELNMRRPELVYPLMEQVDAGYYNGMYIHRAIPGLLVETGEGSWLGRAPWRIALPQDKGRYATSGELGLVENADGSYGPHLVMMRGSTDLERKLVPPTLVVGWLVEGGELLRAMRKGDVISKAYGRGFPAGPEPYVVTEGR